MKTEALLQQGATYNAVPFSAVPACRDEFLNPYILSKLIVDYTQHVLDCGARSLEEAAPALDDFCEGVMWWGELAYQCLDSRSPQRRFTPQHLNNIVASFYKLGLHPGEEFVDLLAEVIYEDRVVNDLSPRALLETARGLAFFDVIAPSEDGKCAALKLMQKAAEQRLDSHQWSQLSLLMYYFDLPCDLYPEKSQHARSDIERRMVTMFQAAAKGRDIDVRTNDYIAELDRYMDCTLERYKKSVAVELDGPTHWVAPGHFDGSTRFMTAVLNKFRPQQIIVRLPYTVVAHWNECTTQLRDTRVRQFVTEALSLNAGGYVYNRQNGFLPL